MTPNTDEFASAILQLLANPDLRRRLGASGRRAVEIKYNWKVLSQELEQLYQVVMTGLVGKAVDSSGYK